MDATIVVSGPGIAEPATVDLSGERVTVGRLPELNDIALEPDPEHLVTRAEHCAFERSGSTWSIVDGGSVNGTFVRRAGELKRVEGRLPLRNGDVVCILGSMDHQDGAQLLRARVRDDRGLPGDSCSGGAGSGRGMPELRRGRGSSRPRRRGERHELHIRAQAHKLVAYMAERSPALCTHAELMDAVWGDEPMHSREELAKIVWELRKELEPYDAGHLIENERGLGYRLRTCP